jgi:hypothetical protein
MQPESWLHRLFCIYLHEINQLKLPDSMRPYVNPDDEFRLANTIISPAQLIVYALDPLHRAQSFSSLPFLLEKAGAGNMYTELSCSITSFQFIWEHLPRI